MNVTRKCITALMVALVMMPAIYSIYFQATQQLIRWEMWEEKDGDEVVMIHASELQWMKAGREIKVNGLMFDVQSIEQIGDSLKITGEYDTKETRLYNELELVEEEHEEDGQQANSLQLLTQVMDDSMSTFLTTDLRPDPICMHGALAADILPNIHLRVIAPPPKA